MFFEGSEKKIEIVVDTLVTGDLRELDKKFWQNLVHQCKATILSEVSSKELTAYLLSESSLFVWSDRITLITCGETFLVRAAEFFVNHFKVESVVSLIFQRKNEYMPATQRSDFSHDINALSNLLQGQVYSFGTQKGSHLNLFNYSKGFAPLADDRTIEILMYAYNPELKELFLDPQLTKDKLYQKLKLKEIMPGFQFDDYIFKPFGYSVNGILGNTYFTIHVTPQDECPYISFETNAVCANTLRGIATQVIDSFKPQSFDVVYFDQNQLSDLFESDEYNIQSQESQNILSQYNVSFAHFTKK